VVQRFQCRRRGRRGTCSPLLSSGAASWRIRYSSSRVETSSTQLNGPGAAVVQEKAVLHPKHSGPEAPLPGLPVTPSRGKEL